MSVTRELLVTDGNGRNIRNEGVDKTWVWKVFGLLISVGSIRQTQHLSQDYLAMNNMFLPGAMIGNPLLG